MYLLTLAHDRHGFHGRLIGVELDEEIASRAARRVEHCKSAEIINKNILDCSDVIRDGTAFFLFNSFNGKVLKSFIEMVEKNCRNGVRLYYFCDYGRSLIDCREGWNILWRGKVTRPPWNDLPATIYEYVCQGDVSAAAPYRAQPSAARLLARSSSVVTSAK